GGPCLYTRSRMSNAPARLTALWAALPLTVVPSRLNAGFGAIDPESERTALARIAAVSPSPSMVLHEGRRLVALWRLKEAIPAPPEPLNESRCGPYAHRPEEVAQRALWALALRLNGDRASIDPRRQTFTIPGTPMPGIFPRREVAVVLGSDLERRVSSDGLPATSTRRQP